MTTATYEGSLSKVDNDTYRKLCRNIPEETLDAIYETCERLEETAHGGIPSEKLQGTVHFEIIPQAGAPVMVDYNQYRKPTEAEAYSVQTHILMPPIVLDSRRDDIAGQFAAELRRRAAVLIQAAERLERIER